jgi:ADP-ribose pyrophosphatase
MQDNPKPETLSRNLIYASEWVNLYADTVRFPNGRVIVRHHLVDFETGAVMAVMTRGDGRYAMVKVPRYTTGRSEWEFPAGRMEPGETVTAAAEREAREETGHGSTGHQVIYEYNPMNGIANQVFYVIRCQASEQGKDFDRGEIAQVGWFTEDEIWGMIHRGEIKDGYTLTSFLLHLHLEK